MRTVFYTAATLNGFLADENGSLDWLFGHDREEDREGSYERFLAGVGALVMGATTYEWVLAHDEGASRRWLYDLPTWVVTHRDLTAPAASCAPFAFARGDVASLHPALVEAAAGRDVWVVGGGDLAGQFADAGLLDEIMVQFAPACVGAGAPLLPRRLALTLLAAERNGDFVDCRYAVSR